MKKLLLDTHIFLWAVMESPLLSKTAKRLVLTTPSVYVSTLSFFELKTKEGKRKLTLPDNFLDLVRAQNIMMLDLTPEQLGKYKILHEENRDPIDNALLAIAESSRSNFLTADEKIIQLQNTCPWIIAA